MGAKKQSVEWSTPARNHPEREKYDHVLGARFRETPTLRSGPLKTIEEERLQISDSLAIARFSKR